jgi:archease protein family (MTH1598/TM1083)
MRFSGARIVQTHTRLQFGRARQPIRFRDRPFAMDSLGLDRVQPEAFYRQSTGNTPHALLVCFHPLMVGANPRVNRLRVEVKAVTVHRFSLIKSDDGWAATVVLNI